jgi:flagellar motor switch/type III secretory pathway protein FliN/flagellar biogenesis protein FliO
MSRIQSLTSSASKSPARAQNRLDSAECGSDRGVDGSSHADVNRRVEMIHTELQDEDSVTAPPSNARDNQALELTIEFGRTFASDDTSGLKPGALFGLDQLADEPVDLVAAGRPVARGELIVVDGKLGVRIVEVLVLLIAAFSFWSSAGIADEPTRPLSSLLQIETNSSEIFDTPLETTRGTRARGESLETDAFVAEKHKATTSDGPSIPLTKSSSPRRTNAASTGDAAADVRMPSSSGWGTTVWSLILVGGSITVGARWLKSRGSASDRGLPNQVLEVLGRRVVDQRTSIVLARCGPRLLVLSSSPSGLRTLTEITDPVEVDCLAGLCSATQRDHGLVETFRDLLGRTIPSTRFTPATNLAEPSQSSTSAARSPESRWPDRFATVRNATPTLPEVRS